MKKHLSVALIFLILFFCGTKMYATVHQLTMCITPSIACQAGDTLKFYIGGAPANELYVVQINSVTVLNNITPVAGYIGQFVIIGNETSFGIGNPEGLCTRSISIQPAGLSTISKDSGISIFPNPFINELHINNINETQINFYTSIGKLVKAVLISAENNVIIMDDLNSGIYFIEITTESKRSVRKIQKL